MLQAEAADFQRRVAVGAENECGVVNAMFTTFGKEKLTESFACFGGYRQCSFFAQDKGRNGNEPPQDPEYW